MSSHPAHVVRPIQWVRHPGSMGGICNPAIEGDAGFDVITSEDVILTNQAICKVPIGLDIALPTGVIGVPIVRSGFAIRGVLVIPTIIDSGYRGPLFVLAMLLGDLIDCMPVCKGTRLAQLLPLPNISGRLVSIQVTELSRSKRGTDGFGSTGES